MELATQTVEKLQKAAGLGFDDRFHHQLATGIPHGDRNRFHVHVHSDIFNVTTHLSCLLGGSDSCQRGSSPKVKVPFLLETNVNQSESTAHPGANSASISEAGRS